MKPEEIRKLPTPGTDASIRYGQLVSAGWYVSGKWVSADHARILEQQVEALKDALYGCVEINSDAAETLRAIEEMK